MSDNRYHFEEYGRAFREHYPEQVAEMECAPYVESVAHASEGLRPREDRFQPVEKRHFGSTHNAWCLCRTEVRTGVPSGYKGLLRTKTPFDVVLYSNLVWELRPKTILEFGSLQGGSGLWYADQLDAFDVEGAEVHSFDLLTKCVSPRARHPRLHFHGVDLFDLKTLDDELLARLPHPWLVVDDSHVNVLNLALHVDRHMEVGDYYVFEDIGLAPTLEFVKGLQVIGGLGYLVDTDYTDAFGYNVTAAPNGWLKKVRSDRK
jgi:cephalosporin hydroxylase